jgi:urease gamma subunit
MTQEEIDVAAYEAAIIKYAGESTLEVIKKRAADLRAEHIENGFAPLIEQMKELNQNTSQLQAEVSRAEFEHQQKAGANVHDQESYEKYLQERQVLILTKASIEKEEKARSAELEKQSATAKIKALAVERQLRDGGTLEECERVIRLENHQLVNDELMEAAK